MVGRIFFVLVISLLSGACAGPGRELMATDERTEEILLDNLLQPMLILQGPDAETQMGKVIGEGLVLPSAAVLKASALPNDAFIPALTDTQHWIEKVVRKRWLPPDYLARLSAIRGGTNDADRIIGVWEIEGRIIQIIATRERLHLIVRYRDGEDTNEQKHPLDRGKAETGTMLLIDLEKEPIPWQFRDFGGLSLGYQDHTVVRTWQQTLLMLTDGTAVKFSLLKFDDRSTPEVESLLPDQQPWFDG